MPFPFQLADLALILVVTGMAVGVAYVPSPRAKSLLFMLPLPFSAALVSTGRGVDATHVAGFGAVWAFIWLVYWLHCRRGVKILLADAAAVVVYCAVSLVLAKVLPSGGESEGEYFWGFWIALGLLAILLMALPHRDEPSHRSLLPPILKFLLVLAIVTSVVLAKDRLRGFMTSFPYVSVFAVYESRHSLYTLARRMSIFLLGFLPMAVVCRWLIPAHGVFVALAAGWAVYLPVYLGLDYVYQRRERNA